MFRSKAIENIVSTEEEYKNLYNIDHIFILKAKYPDDNDIFEIFDTLSHYDWCAKLRGPHEGPAKIQNTKNNHEFFHGYVFGVSSENLMTFEKTVLLTALNTGYTFEKLDMFQTKKELKENHFNSLFEENE